MTEKYKYVILCNNGNHDSKARKAYHFYPQAKTIMMQHAGYAYPGMDDLQYEI